MNTPLPDGGPIYQETNFDFLVVEPWNAVSSLLFLIPVIYWVLKLKGQYQNYPFLLYCMPWLFLGGLGSTLYHAFRSSYYLLLLDVLPITILTLSVGLYFWYKILPRKWHLLLVAAIFTGLRFISFAFIEGQLGVNLSYFITGVMMFLPAVLFLIKTRFIKVEYLIGAVILFSLSLLFRKIDSYQLYLLPMGTHWLWHLVSAAGAMSLSFYLYFIANKNPGFSLKKAA